MKPEAGYYQCACDDGRFDAEDRPFAGPANLPLRTIPAVIAGFVVRVGEP